MEASLTEPGYFGDSVNHIHIIEDFVEPLDLEHMQTFLPHIKQWENGKETEYNEAGECIYDDSYWRDRVCSGPIIQRINPWIFELVDKYINKMAGVIQNAFSVEVSNRPPVLVRWLPGNEQQPHAD